MCGRYAASALAEDLAQVFGIAPEHVLDRPEPSYNVAPTDPVPAVLAGAQDDEGARELRALHWGLVPCAPFLAPTRTWAAQGVPRPRRRH